MSTNEELHARRAAAIPRGVSNLLAVYLDSAENAELRDVEGRRYIDFAAGIAVLNTGHNHPLVKRAALEQIERFTHACFQVTPYESYVALAERLNRVVPGVTPKKTIFLSTGAEAVENSVKIARAYTGRPAVIAFSGGFHGRTLMGLALTGKVVPYKKGFGPFPGDVYHAPFPMTYHGITTERSLEALETLFKADVDPRSVAAIIVEPVLGEGGFYVAPVDFLRALRRVCDEHGILLIIDEIQTGFARTGRLFAIEHAGVEPDMMTLAKSLAGGYPLSAVTGKAAIMDAPEPGGLGGTYAGSPIACAAGLAVLDVIERDKLTTRAAGIGDHLMSRLRTLAQGHSSIGDVRGLGAMVAFELVRDGDPRQPDTELTKALVAAVAKQGLVLLSCGIFSNVIRILVPLTASDALIDEGLGIIEHALGELSNTRPRNSRAAS